MTKHPLALRLPTFRAQQHQNSKSLLTPRLEVTNHSRPSAQLLPTFFANPPTKLPGHGNWQNRNPSPPSPLRVWRNDTPPTASGGRAGSGYYITSYSPGSDSYSSQRGCGVVLARSFTDLDRAVSTQTKTTVDRPGEFGRVFVGVSRGWVRGLAGWLGSLCVLDFF